MNAADQPLCVLGPLVSAGCGEPKITRYQNHAGYRGSAPGTTQCSQMLADVLPIRGKCERSLLDVSQGAIEEFPSQFFQAKKSGDDFVAFRGQQPASEIAGCAQQKDALI